MNLQEAIQPEDLVREFDLPRVWMDAPWTWVSIAETPQRFVMVCWCGTKIDSDTTESKFKTVEMLYRPLKREGRWLWVYVNQCECGRVYWTVVRR